MRALSVCVRVYFPGPSRLPRACVRKCVCVCVHVCALRVCRGDVPGEHTRNRLTNLNFMCVWCGVRVYDARTEVCLPRRSCAEPGGGSTEYAYSHTERVRESRGAIEGAKERE